MPGPLDFNDCFYLFCDFRTGCSSPVLGSFSDNHTGVCWQSLAVAQTKKQREKKWASSGKFKLPPATFLLIPSTEGTDQEAWGVRLNLADYLKQYPKSQGSGMVLQSQLRKTLISISVLQLSINMHLSNLSKLSVTPFLYL